MSRVRRRCGIVVKGKFSPLCLRGGIGYDWFIVSGIEEMRDIRKVSRNEAEWYIAENGLELMLESELGEVWDLASNEFTRRARRSLGRMSRSRLYNLHRKWDLWMA